MFIVSPVSSKRLRSGKASGPSHRGDDEEARRPNSFKRQKRGERKLRALKEARNNFNEKEEERDTGDERLVLPSPSEPMATARIFVGCTCLRDGLLTLRYWRGGWWMWEVQNWIEVDEKMVRSILYRFTEHAVFYKALGVEPWAPNRYKITDLLDALSSICILRPDTDQPCWLDGEKTSNVIVSVKNGLLDVGQRKLLPHTPNFFNQTSVPFDYLENAPPPQRWLEFLSQLWPNEPLEIDVLGEWFGYVVSGRTDLHKILLMVGPTRGGKGAIARVLGALIGRKNVAGPTLSSLNGEFGLAPLLGKSLAVVSDARFSGKNGNIVVERLLSISGEDTLTVNRKYRDQWTGKLPSRLHILSNELPTLFDASTAIIGRIVLLMLSNSWLGREDHKLEPALHEELTGILSWALDGLQRLTFVNGNKFTSLPRADEAIIQMRDLASPVAAFVREKCEVGPGKEIAVDELYIAYRAWAEENGYDKKSKPLVGRDLRAAVPAISMMRPRSASFKSKRPRVYSGICLKIYDDE
jgi:putative DNA primase/helicase